MAANDLPIRTIVIQTRAAVAYVKRGSDEWHVTNGLRLVTDAGLDWLLASGNAFVAVIGSAPSGAWHVADCTTCGGGQRGNWFVPFEQEADRDRLADRHAAATGHQVDRYAHQQTAAS